MLCCCYTAAAASSAAALTPSTEKAQVAIELDGTAGVPAVDWATPHSTSAVSWTPCRPGARRSCGARAARRTSRNWRRTPRAPRCSARATPSARAASRRRGRRRRPCDALCGNCVNSYLSASDRDQSGSSRVASGCVTRVVSGRVTTAEVAKTHCGNNAVTTTRLFQPASVAEWLEILVY